MIELIKQKAELEAIKCQELLEARMEERYQADTGLRKHPIPSQTEIRAQGPTSDQEGEERAVAKRRIGEPANARTFHRPSDFETRKQSNHSVIGEVEEIRIMIYLSVD